MGSGSALFRQGLHQTGDLTAVGLDGSADFNRIHGDLPVACLAITSPGSLSVFADRSLESLRHWIYLSKSRLSAPVVAHRGLPPPSGGEDAFSSVAPQPWEDKN
jgi:hypothetical protein